MSWRHEVIVAILVGFFELRVCLTRRKDFIGTDAFSKFVEGVGGLDCFIVLI